jgi:lipopolysaccharide cholinephosphotransferase
MMDLKKLLNEYEFDIVNLPHDRSLFSKQSSRAYKSLSAARRIAVAGSNQCLVRYLALSLSLFCQTSVDVLIPQDGAWSYPQDKDYYRLKTPSETTGQYDYVIDCSLDYIATLFPNGWNFEPAYYLSLNTRDDVLQREQKVQESCLQVNTLCCIARTAPILGSGLELPEQIATLFSEALAGTSAHFFDTDVLSSYVYAGDLLSALFLCMGLRITGVYDIASGECAVSQIAQMLHERMSLAMELHFAESDPVNSDAPAMVSALRLQQLGWQPAISALDAAYICFTSMSAQTDPVYLTDISLRKHHSVQNILLRMMQDVDAICNEAGISYSLAGGTLLGAYRDKGFIPWDDDIDIMMTRSNYEKFLKVAPKELGQAYFLQCSSTDKDWCYAYAKLRLLGTLLVTDFSQQTDSAYQGIFLDIFVQDNTSANRLAQRMHSYTILFWRFMVRYKWVGAHHKSLPFFPRIVASGLAHLLPLRFCMRRHEQALQRYDRKETGLLLDGTGMHLRRGPYPASWLEELTRCDFAGNQFSASAHTSLYLRYLFGDTFCELPPLHQRRSDHKISVIDFGPYDSDIH